MLTEQTERLIKQGMQAYHAKRLNCAEAVLLTMCRIYGIEGDFAPRMATPFGGGMGIQSSCGALTGGIMVIGLRLGREEGGDRTKCVAETKKFLAWFQKEAGTLDCRTLTGYDTSDPAQNAAFRAESGRHDTFCVPLVGKVCRYLAENIE